MNPHVHTLNPKTGLRDDKLVAVRDPTTEEESYIKKIQGLCKKHNLYEKANKDIKMNEVEMTDAEWKKEMEEFCREMNSFDLRKPSVAEQLKFDASIVWKPEETIEEFYRGILSEMEWYHNGYGYYIEHTVPGWDIYYRNLNSEKEVSSPYWEVCPHEHFDTRADLTFNFKLKNDGRTPAEYICDYYGKPRILVPPVPEYLPDV